MVFECGIVCSGEGMQVGQRKAAAGRTQQGERCNAVPGMEQRAGEGDEVENLLALVEGFNLNRAEWDPAVAVFPV